MLRRVEVRLGNDSASRSTGGPDRAGERFDSDGGTTTSPPPLQPRSYRPPRLWRDVVVQVEDVVGVPGALESAQPLELGVAVARAGDLGRGVGELVDVAAREEVGPDDRHRPPDPVQVRLVERRV